MQQRGFTWEEQWLTDTVQRQAAERGLELDDVRLVPIALDGRQIQLVRGEKIFRFDIQRKHLEYLKTDLRVQRDVEVNLGEVVRSRPD